MKTKKAKAIAIALGAAAVIALCLALPGIVSKIQDERTLGTSGREHEFTGSVSETVAENETAAALEAGRENTVVEREWLVNGERENTNAEVIYSRIDELEAAGVLAADDIARLEAMLETAPGEQVTIDGDENGQTKYIWNVGEGSAIQVTVEPHTDKITGFYCAGAELGRDPLELLTAYKKYLGVDGAGDWERIKRADTDGWYSASLEMYIQTTSTSDLGVKSLTLKAMSVPPEAAAGLPRV